jgi:hypothetical protein
MSRSFDLAEPEYDILEARTIEIHMRSFIEKIRNRWVQHRFAAVRKTNDNQLSQIVSNLNLT